MISTTRQLVGALLLGAVTVTATASGSPTTVTAKSVTYVDERGEDPGAPDITTVDVSNDDAGRLSFRVNTPGRQRMTQDMRVRVVFSTRGKLYFLLADPYKPSPVKVALYRCEPGTAGDVVCSPFGGTSLTFRYARGARFSFNVSEFGIDPAVDKRVAITFDALIYAGLRVTPGAGFDFSEVRQDRAPSRHPRTFRYVAVFDP